MSHPNSLIKSILDAREGSQELDRSILNWIADLLGDGKPEDHQPPPISSSLDATRLLVPEPFGWRCWTDLGSGMGHARLSHPWTSSRAGAKAEWVECQFQRAHTAELALCVAAINLINAEEVRPPAMCHERSPSRS